MVFIGPTNQFVNVVTDAANGNVVRIVVDVVSVTFYLTRFSAAAAAFSVALKIRDSSPKA
jgi:hypothetical protein